MLLVIGMATIFMVQELAVPVIFCSFALGSPIRALWSQLMNRKPRISDEPPTHHGEQTA